MDGRAAAVVLASGMIMGFAADSRGQTEREWAAARAVMVESEVATAGVKDLAVLAVMRTTPRHEFVPANLRQYSYRDMSLPIGEHQTISPPFIVAAMTQALRVEPSFKVLEIGTGSGYQAAVLSGLVKEVYTIEINSHLAERARAVFERLNYRNIKPRVGDGFRGWPEHAPFDRIIVTCSPEQVPQPLVDQLVEGGRMVIPLGERYQQLLCTLVKTDGKLVLESRQPTHFVPMTGRAEALRQKLPDGPVSPLANGTFEERLEDGSPAAWYYVRQANLEVSVARPEGKQCLAFDNRVPGCSSQALQAIGIDGRETSVLELTLWVRGHGIRRETESAQHAGVVVSFSDDQRAPVGLAAARVEGHVRVAPREGPRAGAAGSPLGRDRGRTAGGHRRGVVRRAGNPRGIRLRSAVARADHNVDISGPILPWFRARSWFPTSCRRRASGAPTPGRRTRAAWPRNRDDRGTRRPAR